MMRLRRTLPFLWLVSAALGLGAVLAVRVAPRAPAAAPPAPPDAFAKKGVAFLEKHCLACHNAKLRRADLSLDAFRTEASLLAGRKTWQNVVQMVRSGEMPPPKKGRARPTLEEVESFTLLVRDVFARADRGARLDPGRVTVRRLNRSEYNNTVRDLIGIDFNPAEDFPSDDIGYGFDNIGDVLTLSPVLMERYLAAAESIAQRAIVVPLPKPPQRWVGSRYLEPATPKAYKWRPLPPMGPLHSLHPLTMAGDYVFRVRVYAELPDKAPARVALLADGKQLKTFDVTATQKAPAILEVTVPLAKGPRRLGVTLLAPAGAKAPTVHVEWFNLNGPTDTRPPSHKRITAFAPGKPKGQQTREVLRRFASRAYRRPATNDEVDRLAKLVEASERRGESWEAGIQLALQAVLVSPKFLFRLELDDRPAGPGPRPVGEHQLASRLSYFLWSSMPDDELLALAAKGTLGEQLDRQVARMLKSPKAKALTENFAMQWLQLRRLKTLSPDPKLFPTFTEQLRNDMLKETELFFDAIVREDRSVLDLLDGNFTFLNARLANHYKVYDTNGGEYGKARAGKDGQPFRGETFVRVTFHDGQRGGILGHASVLTVTSNPTRTSPVKRGRWVLEQLLGTPPPPPPPDVPELPDSEKAMLMGSLRQRMEKHRTNPACASCHARMDPIGFAFENFDAIGAFRTHDGKFKIDASGTLPGGKSFDGPGGLKRVLKGQKELVARNLIEKLMTYALGRGLEHYDKPAVDKIEAALARDGYKFSTLVTEIARSAPFRLRRGKEETR